MRATELKLFPATEPLTDVGIDIIDSLIKSNNEIIALLVITDCFLELTKTVLLRTATAQDIDTSLTKN